jgi:hypothetical protein
MKKTIIGIAVTCLIGLAGAGTGHAATCTTDPYCLDHEDYYAWDISWDLPADATISGNNVAGQGGVLHGWEDLPSVFDNSQVLPRSSQVADLKSGSGSAPDRPFSSGGITARAARVPVPIPSAAVILGSGILALAGLRKKRKSI